MVKTNSIRGYIALMVAHCAGMLDLVALPVWIGTLIEHYHLDPQQAGGLATIFLFGAVIASVTLAPRLHSCNGRWVAVCGFALATLSFGAVTQIDSFQMMAVLHGLGGLSAGAALSVTHGTIARTSNPHRMFAIVSAALGIFAIVFLGATPMLVAKFGGPTLFMAFSIVMLTAALTSLIAFPVADSRLDQDPSVHADKKNKIPTAVWFGVVGISLMGLVQAMTFSFLERVGNAHNFGLEAITGVLIALGIVNLFPAPLAGFLEKRISTRWVLFCGPGVQALLCLTIMSSMSFNTYAFAASVFASVIIFTHTFVFGFLAKLDPSGRALAATPAMLMIGAAVGPILGGTLVKAFGFQSIGLMALCIAAIGTFCFVCAISKGHPVVMQEKQA